MTDRFLELKVLTLLTVYSQEISIEVAGKEISVQANIYVWLAAGGVQGYMVAVGRCEHFRSSMCAFVLYLNRTRIRSLHVVAIGLLEAKHGFSLAHGISRDMPPFFHDPASPRVHARIYKHCAHRYKVGAVDMPERNAVSS